MQALPQNAGRLYLGQGRIAALAHEAGADRASLPSPTENEACLAHRFRREVLATGAD